MSGKTKFWLFVAIIFILILSFVVMESRAQEPVQVRSDCHGVRISASADVDYLIIWYEAHANWVWYTADEGSVKSFAVIAGTELLITFHTTSGEETGFYYTVPDCDKSPAPITLPTPDTELIIDNVQNMFRILHED